MQEKSDIPKIIRRKSNEPVEKSCIYKGECKFGDICEVMQDTQEKTNRTCIMAYGFSLHDELLRE